MWPNSQFHADLVTFTEGSLNGKLHFFALKPHLIQTYHVFLFLDMRNLSYFDVVLEVCSCQQLARKTWTNNLWVWELSYYISSKGHVLYKNNGMKLMKTKTCAAPLTHLSPVLHFIQQPVIWFAMRIKWLVSIWNVRLGGNGLICFLIQKQPWNLAWGQFWRSVKFNSFSANFTKWSNTLKQFVGNLLTNCLSVFDHFVGLAALKGLRDKMMVDFLWRSFPVDTRRRFNVCKMSTRHRRRPIDVL